VATREIRDEVESALSWLEKKSTRKDRDNLARFGINARQAWAKVAQWSRSEDAERQRAGVGPREP
jgi:hypothetical protein